jgi:hypothetical protein
VHAKWRVGAKRYGARSSAIPTDELIPDHDSSVFTMATTLPAPPEKVWPWLAQMGGDRAGWYSWDRLDRSSPWAAERQGHYLGFWTKGGIAPDYAAYPRW